MSAPFQIAGSTITDDSVGCGAPNAMVCQWASKPSAVTVDVTGRTSPRKLGVGQDDRRVASRSLPPKRTLNEVVPRRLALSLKGTVLAGCNVSAGTLARITEAPPQARWSLMISRHGCQDVSVLLIAMRSSERNPARLAFVPKATKLSFQKNWPFRSLAKSRNRDSSGTRKDPCISILAS